MYSKKIRFELHEPLKRFHNAFAYERATLIRNRTSQCACSKLQLNVQIFALKFTIFQYCTNARLYSTILQTLVSLARPF